MMMSNTHDYKVNWNAKPKGCKFKMYASKMFVADDSKSKQDKSDALQAVNESFMGDNFI